MSTKLSALSLAGALLLPQAILANDRDAGMATKAAAAEVLALPPLPYAETIPWLNSTAAPRPQKVDILLGPHLNNLTLDFDPAGRRAPRRFSSASSGVNVATE